MLSITDLGIEISGRWLLQKATYNFQGGEHIGLIGRNGAGKSTLLRVLVGQMQASEGQVNRSKDLKVAFFNQDLLSFQTDQSIDEVVRQAFAPLLKMKEELDELLQRVEAGEQSPELWDELAHKQEVFDASGGQKIDAETHGMLNGLGFSPDEYQQPYANFSGGWRMRVMLAKMLLEKPDVLLLDEPTNHLDLPSIQWLEGYLKSFPGCVIIVSHDRFFLDRMVNKILEISLSRLNEYAGNYAFYLKERENRREQHQRAYENQQKYIAEQERFIERFRAKATKARQAQSKIKMLDKLERIEAPEEESFDLNINFEFSIKSGKEVLELGHVSKAYGPKEILKETSAHIWRGDKIGLIGANGLGKSTLLRIIGQHEVFDGNHKLGHQVNMSFFAQHQLESLHLQETVLDEIAREATHRNETYLRNILGAFMFSGEEVDKKIGVLSGGERSRVALAKTLLSKANFLLLDEPTNHLDIPSIQVLVQALQAYEGTYVVVSHDRYFLEQVTNKIWYIENRQVKEYPGSFAEYQTWVAQKELAHNQEASPKSPVTVPQKPQVPAGTSNRQAKNRIKKLKRELEPLEAQIELLEQQKTETEIKMGQPEIASNFDKLQEVQQELSEQDKSLHTLTERWEEIMMELDELGEKM
ncbi:MAG: ABC-F family ATP-binding cassette domain-containing protein [Bacteroidota bacterium]